MNLEKFSVQEKNELFRYFETHDNEIKEIDIVPFFVFDILEQEKIVDNDICCPYCNEMDPQMLTQVDDGLIECGSCGELFDPAHDS